MCGIVGYASPKTNPEKEWLENALILLKHRGPDDSGVWISDCERIGLGHTRLSILDLSISGHQPMMDSSKKTTIIFNGEIYNYLQLKEILVGQGYLFNTTTDTEVLLASWDLWGVDCVKKFKGMFAFAIYDSRKNILFMARDRAGEKPLFYQINNGIIRFASEMKALFANQNIDRQLCLASLDCYLSMGYIPGESSIINTIKKLPPAHYLLFDIDNESISINNYWNLSQVKASGKSDLSDDTLLDKLEELLEDSVRHQLVADVPVGVLLSGGVDSSIITALAAKVSDKKIRTYTVSFPEYSNIDESVHSSLIAKHFNTDHYELDAGHIDVSLLSELAFQFDEPIVDSSMIPTYLLCKLVREHCTVALGGDGGDELFGGYKHYDRLLRFQEIARFIPKPIRKVVSSALETALPIGYKGKSWAQLLGYGFNADIPFIAEHFDKTSRIKLMDGHYGRWNPSAEKVRKFRYPIEGDLLQKITINDFENYLPEDILVKVDRSSMKSSLEMRAPFLDHKIIEYAFNLPSRMRATSKDRKIILKMLCAKLLPSEFDLHRKQGFVIPLSAWLKRGPWRDYFESILYDKSGIFDPKFVAQLFKINDLNGNTHEKLFALTFFELWRRQHDISI